MSTFCSNCGQPFTLKENYCKSCGMKISQIQDIESNERSDKESLNLDKFNQKINVKNTQKSTVYKSLIVAVVAFFIAVLPFFENNPMTGLWGIAFIGFFIFLAALIVAFIFNSRAKKLQSLLTGENIVASWILSSDEKIAYVNHLYESEKAKNKGIFWITTVLIVVIFGIFILVIDEGKVAMFMVMLILIGFIAAFAFGMPNYYKSKNSNADGQILIGKKFAYINGFFHNWDFPLSGLKNVKIINEPFYGIHLTYYYTDRTWTNTESINIPASAVVDLKEVISNLKIAN